MPHAVCFERIYKWFSSEGKPVLEDLSFAWPKERLICLLGASGSGKTTILRLISGLDVPNRGSIKIFDKRATQGHTLILAPHRRQVGFIFQDLALWPHMTVYENIAFGLKVKKTPEPDSIMGPFVDFLGIAPLLQRYPHELSGGQQQLVAIARSMVLNPKILLMDEPMANLDIKLRLRLQEKIRQLIHEFGITVVYVTHNHEEALRLGDYIAVLNQGKIVEFSPPDAFLASKSQFVRDFFQRESI